MTFKELVQRGVDINLLEKDLMRDLTEDEKDLIANEGFKSFLEDSGITLKDLSLIKRVREIFGSFFTGDIEVYEELVNKSDNEKVIEVLEDVLKDLKKEKEDKSQDLIDVYILRLKKGETLELEPDVLDQVIDRLWNTETNIKIEVRNNKIRLH
jgi:hypothetical protein